MNERLEEHYNRKHASDLDPRSLDIVPTDLRWPSDRVEAAAIVLQSMIPPGARVLELGSGDGRLAESLRLRGVDYASYTLVELSDVRLDGLRRRLSDSRYAFVKGDAEALADTVGGSYDVVVMVALIEHLIDPLGAMTQVRSVLAPGGFAYVDTPNIAKWTRRTRLAAGRFPATAGVNEGLTTFEGTPTDLYDEGHLHYFTYRSLEKMLIERCGFARAERFGYFSGPRRIPVGVGARLAQWWPTLFGELALVARAD